MLKIDDENNVYLTRGDTANFLLDLVDEDEQPYTMTADEIIIFSLRRIYDKGHILVQKQSSSPSFSLSTNDTKDLTFGSYKYDIYLYNQVTYKLDTFIADRDFVIGEEVHDFNE
jgi:hypothetical protein